MKSENVYGIKILCSSYTELYSGGVGKSSTDLHFLQRNFLCSHASPLAQTGAHVGPHIFVTLTNSLQTKRLYKYKQYKLDRSITSNYNNVYVGSAFARLLTHCLEVWRTLRLCTCIAVEVLPVSDKGDRQSLRGHTISGSELAFGSTAPRIRSKPLLCDDTPSKTILRHKMQSNRGRSVERQRVDERPPELLRIPLFDIPLRGLEAKLCLLQTWCINGYEELFCHRLDLYTDWRYIFWSYWTISYLNLIGLTKELLKNETLF